MEFKGILNYKLDTPTLNGDVYKTDTFTDAIDSALKKGPIPISASFDKDGEIIGAVNNYKINDGMVIIEGSIENDKYQIIINDIQVTSCMQAKIDENNVIYDCEFDKFVVVPDRDSMLEY